MRVYIVRHGEAAAASRGERPLTELGRAQALAAGELLAAEAPQAVLCSPKLRTCQTAESIAEGCAGIEVLAEDSLLPPSEGLAVCRALDAAALESVVLVSHMPLVAELVAWFTRGAVSEQRLPGFPPAAIAALQMEVAGAGTAELLWYAQPPGFEKLRH